MNRDSTYRFFHSSEPVIHHYSYRGLKCRFSMENEVLYSRSASCGSGVKKRSLCVSAARLRKVCKKQPARNGPSKVSLNGVLTA
jgi:hypothetical protein